MAATHLQSRSMLHKCPISHVPAREFAEGDTIFHEQFAAVSVVFAKSLANSSGVHCLLPRRLALRLSLVSLRRSFIRGWRQKPPI